MSAKIVNLRTERKRRRREDSEAQAAENRARHGRTKAEKGRDAAAAESEKRHLDGHRLGRPDDDKD